MTRFPEGRISWLEEHLDETPLREEHPSVYRP